MLLLRGITGSFPAGETRPSVDFRSFKTLCHTLAREAQGSLVHVASCDAGRSFHYAILDLPAGRVAIATNATYPFVAFAKCELAATTVHTPLQFLNPPNLAGLMERPWRTLSCAELEQRVTPELLARSELDEVERRQIRHWNPRRAGDIIFNFWD